MSTLTARWVEQTADFEDLRQEWNELLQASDSDCLFLTWEWLYTWWRNMADRHTLAILLIYEHERLIAIAPLSVRPAQYRRLVPFRVLEFLGSGNAGSDYLSFIIQQGLEQRALTAMSDAISSRGLAIELSNIDRASEVMVSAALALRDQGYQVLRQTQYYSPYIDLSEHSWQSFMSQKKGAADLSRFNKKLKRLKRDFTVSFEMTADQHTRIADLNILTALHMMRRNELGDASTFNSPASRRFHESLSQSALENGWLRLFVLRLNDRPAAAVYGFSYRNTLYYYQAGFDPEFSQYSVGFLALALTIQQATTEGLHKFDFLHGEEQYKYAWTSNDRELVKLSLYPPGYRGKLCDKVMIIRDDLKNAVRFQTGRILRSATIKQNIIASHGDNNTL